MLILGRGFAAHRILVLMAAISGCFIGMAGGFSLANSLPGALSFEIVRGVVGVSFFLIWGIAVASLYRSTGQRTNRSWGKRLVASRLCAAGSTFVPSAVMGTLWACALTAAAVSSWAFVYLALATAIVAYITVALEKKLPRYFSVTPAGIAVSVSALLLFNSSSSLRLDLFAPLTMKVMKFTHDFVHQFFESMLIPDHVFFTTAIWNYIGILFSNGVGLWGALFIWFAPAFLVIAATAIEHLPPVAHIRQGAQRRKLMAEAIGMRRLRLVVPVTAVIICAGAVYQSRFPKVEYWDPKPLTVTANPSGEIIIPKKGEIDLEDGKLHKFLYKQGGKEVRFFILKTPEGVLTVDLDACAICKPDGYGQAEGTLICYYCKTLIPLETVGKPGGCNPVPMAFTAKEDSVHIDGLLLINNWSSTVQSTTKIKEGGK